MKDAHFEYDGFLSHATADLTAVCAIAEQLHADGIRVCVNEGKLQTDRSAADEIERGLESSRVLVLCVSGNVSIAEWIRLEAGTFRFRDPLNKSRRFILLRLDDKTQNTGDGLPSMSWLPENRGETYPRLLEACRPLVEPTLTAESEDGSYSRRRDPHTEPITLFRPGSAIASYAFGLDGKRALSAASDKSVKLWDVDMGNCLRVLKGHTGGRR